MPENQTQDQAPSSELILSIRNRGKAIPYFGSDKRPDGNENHGFKALKGHTEDAGLVPEILDNTALRNAVITLNDPSTPFFTIGCAKSCNREDSGYWMKGYLEFSFNYIEFASDARYYFELFFHFNDWFRQQFQRAMVGYHFELEGAIFTDKSSAHGFTSTVWIRTLTLATEEETKGAWAWALNLLVEFLKTVPVNLSLRDQIYL